MPQLNFDISQVPPDAGHEPLPSGWYVAQIHNTAMKPTKAGNGHCLNIEYDILSEGHRGRKVWDNLCIEHPNPDTVKIARSKLSAICHAVGEPRCTDTVQLHNRPLKIDVKVKRDDKTGNLSNAIKGYAAVDKLAVTPPVQAAPVSAAQTQYPQADGGIPPWMRTPNNN